MRKTSPQTHISFIAFILLLGAQSLSGQSFMFGVKGGGVLGTQSWNGFDRDPLLAYHGGIFIEPWKEDAKSSFFLQLGYHQRGSAQRAFNFSGGSNNLSFVFNNSVLSWGVKNRFNTYNLNKPYYMIGLRLEYTLSTNLDEYEIYGGYFPLEPFTNKFNYGPMAGVGYEMRFSEFVGAFVEASINPDISLQYEQPPLNNIIDPFTNNPRSIGMQSIRNVTFEVTLGLRLLRKIEWID